MNVVDVGHATLDLCDVLGIALDQGREADLDRRTTEELDAIREHLKRSKQWP